MVSNFFSQVCQLFKSGSKTDESALLNERYKNGVHVYSYFKSIRPPCSGYKVEPIRQPAICDFSLKPIVHNAVLLTRVGEIISIACIRESLIHALTNTFQPPEINSISDVVIQAALEIIDLHRHLSVNGVIDVEIVQDVYVSVDIHRHITVNGIIDATELFQDISSVAIVDVCVILKSRIDGKTYHNEATKNESLNPKQNTATEGLANSSQRPRAESQNKPNNVFDVFDVIFPILQQPLGKKFDSVFSFPAPLYPFQIEGVKFLIDRRSVLLGDEMGLGKTVQTITACRVLFRRGGIASVCVICPKAVLTNWERELWKWAPELRVIKIEGLKSKRELLWKTGAHVYICTYETLREDFEKVNERLYPRAKAFERKTHFDLIILDEIQKTKNPSAKLTQAVRGLDTNYRWGMSGTPLENGIGDLITICETLDPNIFAKADGSLEQIKEAYKPIFLRRRSRDVLKDLPEKITHEIWLDLSPEQQRKYELAEREGIITLEGLGESITLQHVLALITKLKQICNYETESGESVKLDYLKDELDELVAEENKALIFSQYPNETLKRIKPRLEVFNPEIYDGSLSDNARNRIVDNFQKNDENKILLLSLKAGNAGITLTRANYVYHFDMWWNPAVAAQAVGRALRIGQKSKKVFERFLLTNGTIEERIYKKVKEKELLFNLVVDDLSEGEFAAGRVMTQDEIFGLFGLKDPKKMPKKTPVNSCVLSTTQIDSLDPFQFENFVSKLYEKMDYHTRITQKTRDGGVDIYAKYSSPTGSYEEIIIQCKHKENPNMTVGVDAIREIFGVLKSNNKLAKAVLVTNAIFSNDATKFASDNNVELIDRHKLLHLISKY